MEKHSGPGEDEMKKLEPDLSVPRKLLTVQIPVFFPTDDYAGVQFCRIMCQDDD
jgi:hypothetical protein